jgi:cytochrome oxidase Cu insertion factor (SCO1/SenC/PrrC family)
MAHVRFLGLKNKINNTFRSKGIHRASSMKKAFILLTLFFTGLNADLFAANIEIRTGSSGRDTITVFITIDDATSKKEKLILVKKEGLFLLEYKTDVAVWISIYDGKNRIMGILEDSDTISIEYEFENFKTTFSTKGRGAQRYFPDNRKNLTSGISLLSVNVNEKNIDTCFQRLNDFEKALSDSINGLGFKEKEVTAILKGYYKREFNYAKRRMIAKVFPNVPLTILSSKSGLSPYLKGNIKNLLNFDPSLYNSPDYTNDVYYCLLQEYMLLTIEKYAPGDIQNKYSFYLKYLPEGKLRERVLCILLEGDFKMLNNTDFLIKTAKINYPASRQTIYRQYVYKLIEEYGTLFRKGERAPDFSLTDATGKVITLKDLLGKVVFMDFWYEKCAPCLSLFSSLKPLKEKYQNNTDVIFLNISTDKKDQWLDAIKKLSLKGYNVYTQELEFTHPIIKDYKVNGYPTTCIIDSRGNFFNASPPYGNIEALAIQIENALKSK